MQDQCEATLNINAIEIGILYDTFVGGGKCNSKRILQITFKLTLEYGSVRFELITFHHLSLIRLRVLLFDLKKELLLFRLKRYDCFNLTFQMSINFKNLCFAILCY